MLNSAKSPPQLPEAWETEPLVNQQEEAVGAPIIPRVAWLVAENQLCNDAQTSRKLHQPSDPGCQDRFNKSSACRDPTTLSEHAKRLARENPAQWNDYLHAYLQKITDPEAFNLNRVDNEQHARELLIHAASLTAAFCCTPVTFGQIKNHTGLGYNFIVLDEAARMPESLSLIPMAKCPEASFLIIGDNKQFGPVVATLDRKDWQSFFGPQRATSLFERIEKSGALLFTLKSNYCPHGKAADFKKS
ncbi:AAA domain protein [Fusarium tjaetaba]|uniref:AAA domain protein n=1 Tax=Fusarium tjaetaba TaxID=1567544 RepID=A0A8H5VGS3_9HYPO|nr:AAA domain protein [Fusarium tjaetaba]KAF5621738.1 AAA domain protein [Fusarium tjaetaba]